MSPQILSKYYSSKERYTSFVNSYGDHITMEAKHEDDQLKFSMSISRNWSNTFFGKIRLLFQVWFFNTIYQEQTYMNEEDILVIKDFINAIKLPELQDDL